MEQCVSRCILFDELLSGREPPSMVGVTLALPSHACPFFLPPFFSRFLAVLGQFERDDVGGGVRKGTADAIS